VRDAEAIQSRGFLTGYNESVWIVILLQAAGGLVSVTVRCGVVCDNCAYYSCLCVAELRSLSLCDYPRLLLSL
jgi:DsbC/DsbD-like thiol-disulfide interchange protein